MDIGSGRVCLRGDALSRTHLYVSCGFASGVKASTREATMGLRRKVCFSCTLLLQLLVTVNYVFSTMFQTVAFKQDATFHITPGFIILNSQEVRRLNQKSPSLLCQSTPIKSTFQHIKLLIYFYAYSLATVIPFQ